jgi:flagellar basal-body rod protein FlgB
MSIDSLPIFSVIRDRLGWLNARQRVIAENVANADTPGYVARDLAQPSRFQRMLGGGQGSAQGGAQGGVQVARTQAGHIAPAAPRTAAYGTVSAPDSETTLDGNSVVVEEQMLRMAESRMAYDAAISFYQKSLSMLRMAARPPGRG